MLCLVLVGLGTTEAAVAVHGRTKGSTVLVTVDGVGEYLSTAVHSAARRVGSLSVGNMDSQGAKLHNVSLSVGQDIRVSATASVVVEPIIWFRFLAPRGIELQCSTAPSFAFWVYRGKVELMLRRGSGRLDCTGGIPAWIAETDAVTDKIEGVIASIVRAALPDSLMSLMETTHALPLVNVAICPMCSPPLFQRLVHLSVGHFSGALDDRGTLELRLNLLDIGWDVTWELRRQLCGVLLAVVGVGLALYTPLPRRKRLLAAVLCVGFGVAILLLTW